jgi:hypothetical protein
MGVVPPSSISGRHSTVAPIPSRACKQRYEDGKSESGSRFTRTLRGAHVGPDTSDLAAVALALTMLALVGLRQRDLRK